MISQSEVELNKIGIFRLSSFITGEIELKNITINRFNTPESRCKIRSIFKQASNEPVKDWLAYSKYKKMLLEFSYTPNEYDLVVGILLDILEL